MKNAQEDVVLIFGKLEAENVCEDSQSSHTGNRYIQKCRQVQVPFTRRGTTEFTEEFTDEYLGVGCCASGELFIFTSTEDGRGK